MINGSTPPAILLLINDAMGATEEKQAQATLLLIDAALSITLSAHTREAAREAAVLLTDYIVRQVDDALRGDGGEHEAV